MPRRLRSSGDHGIARHRADVALVIIDLLNEFDFPEGERLRKQAEAVSRQIAKLRDRFHEHHLPVIYANDNFGQWKSDRQQVVERSLRQGCRGREIAARLLPGDEDYFVLKPKHSAFYSTTLETLLSFLGAKTLVLTGVAGNICVLHTALDAYVRGFGLVIPRDCVTSNTPADHRFSLRQFERVLGADTRPHASWWKTRTR